MTVQEIQAKLPEAQVYELRQDCKYIIVIDPTFVDRKQMEMFCEIARDEGLPAFVGLITTYPDEAIRLLEMKDEKENQSCNSSIPSMEKKSRTSSSQT